MRTFMYLISLITILNITNFIFMAQSPTITTTATKLPQQPITTTAPTTTTTTSTTIPPQPVTKIKKQKPAPAAPTTAPDDDLFTAIAKNSKSGVAKALQKGANASAKDSMGNTALNAAFDSSPIIMQLLLDAGADANVVDKNGIAPVIKMARSNDPQRLFKIFLQQKYNINWNVQDENGDNPLMILIKRINQGGDRLQNLSAAAGALLDFDNITLDTANNVGQTALHLALSGIAWDLNNLGEKIMSHHPNVNAADSDGNSPLILAVKNSNIGAIPLLVKEGGVNIDASDKNGRTALYLAQNPDSKKACSNVMVALLINAGATTPDLISELTLAASMGKGKRAVEELINQGVSANSKDKDGNTALIVAAQAGNDDIVSYLLSVQDQYHVQQAPRIFDPKILKQSICYSYSLLPFAEYDAIDVTIKNNAGNDALTMAKGSSKALIQNYIDNLSS